MICYGTPGCKSRQFAHYHGIKEISSHNVYFLSLQLLTSPTGHPRSAKELNASPKNSFTFLGIDKDGGPRFRKSKQFAVTPTLSAEEKEASRIGDVPPMEPVVEVHPEPPTELETLSYSPAPSARQILPLAPNLDEDSADEDVTAALPTPATAAAPPEASTSATPPAESTFLRPNLRQAQPRRSVVDILVEEQAEKERKVEVQNICISCFQCTLP